MHKGEGRPDPIQDVPVISLPKETLVQTKKEKKNMEQNNGKHRAPDVARQLRPCYEL